MVATNIGYQTKDFEKSLNKEHMIKRNIQLIFPILAFPPDKGAFQTTAKQMMFRFIQLNNHS